MSVKGTFMRQAIPRMVIAGTQSGAGKTTVTAGLLAAFRKKNFAVQSFKIGPDYIDPGYHELASKSAAHNLDSWLMPKKTLRDVFFKRARHADIAIVEGVMGLYDGGKKGVSSTAEIAKILRAPVLLVIDVSAMGASAAAIALGFRNYDPKVQLAGVILNRVGSKTHETMIRKAMTKLAIPVFGAVRRDAEIILPERHLGLVPTEENAGFNIEKIAAAVGESVDLDMLVAVAETAEHLEIYAAEEHSAPVKTRIAVAKDEAFSFYYPESIAVLENCGAQIVPFSPLHEGELPDADGVIIGGGFPEMFAEKLSENTSMRDSIKRAAKNNMPIYAECGGYMYLTNAITDFAGKSFPMVGAIDVTATMNDKLQTVGYVMATMQTETVLGPKGAMLKGHEFHFSSTDASGTAAPFIFERLRNGEKYSGGYASGNLLASYLHIHFAGCKEAAEYFVEKCVSYGERKNLRHDSV